MAMVTSAHQSHPLGEGIRPSLQPLTVQHVSSASLTSPTAAGVWDSTHPAGGDTVVNTGCRAHSRTGNS